MQFRHRRGFTLLELLIVMFIAGILFAIAGGAFVRTSKMSRRELNRIDRTMSARLAMEKIVRDVQSSFAYRQENEAAILFRGIDQTVNEKAADEITLVRPKLGAILPTELEKVSYSVKGSETDTGTQMTVVSRRAGIKEDLQSAKETTVGIVESSNVFSLNLEYLAGSPDEGQWLPSWELSERLPTAVRVTVEVSDHRQPGVVEFETVARVHAADVQGATP